MSKCVPTLPCALHHAAAAGQPAFLVGKHYYFKWVTQAHVLLVQVRGHLYGTDHPDLPVVVPTAGYRVSV